MGFPTTSRTPPNSNTVFKFQFYLVFIEKNGSIINSFQAVSNQTKLISLVESFLIIPKECDINQVVSLVESFLTIPKECGMKCCGLGDLNLTNKTNYLAS
jgi:hypothetical protein